ncbi:hypothetical protein [Mycobacterium sp. ACS4331]|uniref:hypothetical protein n=1 Tax=Mycobacterium sp. ACS4331 TaxID=1834121 RepID=UPI0007FCA3AC|nr:hypothetical protein [Mycobacterium sp. ACS4331]OBF13017.1 hypothetical protein A5727_01680 [Mycobacterium sp. ACS4331]
MFLLLRLLAALTVAVMAVANAASAAAEPEENPGIGWRQLGLPDRIDIVGSDQPNDVAVPVPPGVVPTVLTGFIGSVVNVVAGRVDVVDAAGTVLGGIVVPADQSTVWFAVDTANAQIVEGRAKLSFVLRDGNQHVDGCTRPPTVALTQLATVFSGEVPNPATIADFLPGYLERIVIRVGPDPATDVQQAALSLVAKLTHLYRPIPVRIDVDTSAEITPTGGPLQRVVDIRHSPDSGMFIEYPGTPESTLVITGSGAELLNQTQLFADRRVALAQTAAASVDSVVDDKPKTTTIKTFDELGMTASTSVQGSTTQYVGFDTAAFGVGPVQHARIHVLADYTPIVRGEGSVVIRSGSTVVASRVLDASGQLDVTGDIPKESITSNVGIAVELRYVPQQQCAPPSDRITFTLNPASTVTVTPGTDNRGGFPVLPGAFTPDFDVAVTEAHDIRYAAQAINLMGQQSSVILQPRLTPLADTVGSGAGLLVVAPGDVLRDAGLNAPLLTGADHTLLVSGHPVTGMNLNGPVGVIQAFTAADRNVLAISGATELIERTFDHIRGLEGRWASLTGDVVATGAAGVPVNLTVREGGALVNEYPGDGWRWWAVASGLIGALLVIGAVVAVLARRRNRNRE